MKFDKKLLKSTVIWSGLAALMLLIMYFGKSFSTIFDNLYSEGIFQIIRVLYDYSFGLIPFPVVYILFILLLYLGFSFTRKMFRREISLLNIILSLVRFSAVIISLFYILWGFNYNQSAVESKMLLPSLAMDTADLQNEFSASSNELFQVLEEIERKGWQLEDLLIKTTKESDIRINLEGVLSDIGYPTYGRVRVRLLNPNGTLLVWNTAGVYIPFVSEGHVDNGLLSYQKPFTLAHEMSHGYGITDEGSCNFLAYLACRNADDLFIRFSGILSYWRYVASEYRMQDEQAYSNAYKKFPPLLVNVLKEIYKNNDLYPEILPSLRYTVYDNYLKAQGIEEGMRNYSRVVQLVTAWRKA